MTPPVPASVQVADTVPQLWVQNNYVIHFSNMVKKRVTNISVFHEHPEQQKNIIDLICYSNPLGVTGAYMGPIPLRIAKLRLW